MLWTAETYLWRRGGTGQSPRAIRPSLYLRGFVQQPMTRHAVDSIGTSSIIRFANRNAVLPASGHELAVRVKSVLIALPDLQLTHEVLEWEAEGKG